MHPRTQSATHLIRPGDVVLFQGDSITNAFRKPDEINNAYQLGAGYALMVASYLLQTRPADNLQFINRGVSGHTLNDLAARWQRDTVTQRPTVISLLVGIIDIAKEAGGDTTLTAAQFERDYRALLQSSLSALPAVRFVLCEPFALPCGMVGESWRQPLAQRQKMLAALAQEFDAVFVPLQMEFDAAARRAPPAYWLYDGIHPTAPGYELIAQAWLRAMRRPAPARRQSVLWKTSALSRNRVTANIPASPAV